MKATKLLKVIDYGVATGAASEQTIALHRPLRSINDAFTDAELGDAIPHVRITYEVKEDHALEVQYLGGPPAIYREGTILTLTAYPLKSFVGIAIKEVDGDLSLTDSTCIKRIRLMRLPYGRYPRSILCKNEEEVSC